MWFSFFPWIATKLAGFQCPDLLGDLGQRKEIHNVCGQHGAQDCANIPSQHYEKRVWAIGGVEGTVLPEWRCTSLECCST